MNNIPFLLNEVSHISRYHKNIALMSGENFNIFRTLNLDSSEVRMHSAFLCEFLNPRGTHGQGDLFLKLFVEQLNIQNFDTINAIAEVEKYIGIVNDDYTRGGRIDILITDSAKRHIIIENKIYAQDQKNQLLRYHNFDPKATILYLSIWGHLSSDLSSSDSENPISCKPISYCLDIIKWLEACKKEAVSLPVIRETIGQYINLIKYYTNQTTVYKMNDEIKKLILKHPEYVDAIDSCTEALKSIVNETEVSFFEKLRESMFPVSIALHDEMTVYIYCNQDADGVHIGYVLKKGEENISRSDFANEYSRILKEIEPRMKNNSLHIGWFNPNPFSRYQCFSGLDKRKILEMHQNHDLLEDLVRRIKAEEIEITNEFIRRIKM